MHLKLAGLWTNRKTTDSTRGIESLGPASTGKVCQISHVPNIFMFLLPSFQGNVITSPALLTFPYSILYLTKCICCKEILHVMPVLFQAFRRFRWYARGWTGGFQLVLGASPGTLGTGRACREPQICWWKPNGWRAPGLKANPPLHFESNSAVSPEMP